MAYCSFPVQCILLSMPPKSMLCKCFFFGKPSPVAAFRRSAPLFVSFWPHSLLQFFWRWFSRCYFVLLKFNFSLHTFKLLGKMRTVSDFLPSVTFALTSRMVKKFCNKWFFIAFALRNSAKNNEIKPFKIVTCVYWQMCLCMCVTVIFHSIIKGTQLLQLTAAAVIIINNNN